MTIEQYSQELEKKWGLSKFHIFIDAKFKNRYRVFAFKEEKKGFEASFAEGIGDTIMAALQDAGANMVLGPVESAKKKKAMMEEAGLLSQ